MNYSVNMVPQASLQAQARAHRLVRWIAACVLAALLLTAGWVVQYTATAGLAELDDRLSDLGVQRIKADAHLVSAKRRRAELAQQLQIVAATRRPQPWARRLANLTEAAPDGVLITRISIDTPAPLTERKESKKPREPNEKQPAPAISDTGNARQHVRIEGHALDHGTLIQLVNSIERIPEWQDVELIRATQQRCGAALVIAFELACHCSHEGGGEASGDEEGEL